MSLTLKFRYRFEAAHRFTSTAAPSCRTPHGHTWYATAIFKMAAAGLDESEMAAEFGALKKAWKSFITETADHSFFHHSKDPLIPHLKKDTPNVRLLEFPGDPTTEMIAGLFALKLKVMHAASGITTVRPVAVHIQETPTNSITFRFEKDGSIPAWLAAASELTKGAAKNSTNRWWLSANPHQR